MKIVKGQRYKVREDLEVGQSYSGIYCGPEKKRYFGQILEAKELTTTGNLSHNSWVFSPEMLIPVDTSIEFVQAGDVITNGSCYRMILYRDDYLILMTLSTDTPEKAKVANASTSILSLVQFLRFFSEWHIHTDELEEITEVTMDEIAEKFNVPVERLKVRKGES